MAFNCSVLPELKIVLFASTPALSASSYFLTWFYRDLIWTRLLKCKLPGSFCDLQCSSWSSSHQKLPVVPKGGVILQQPRSRMRLAKYFYACDWLQMVFLLKKKKKTALAALFENVSLYFSFRFVLLSNNIAQLQRQSLAVQISAGFFCCVVAYSRGKKNCRNSVL